MADDSQLSPNQFFDTKAVDTKSMEAAVISGASKNFEPIFIMSYYLTKDKVNQGLLLAKDRASIRNLTEQLLDYIPEEERRDELFNMIDILDDEYMAKRARDKGVIKADDIPEIDKIESMRRACSTIRYKVQLEINQAHGLVKQRGMGCGFPFYSEGRFMFPMTDVLPDGDYVKLNVLPEEIQAKAGPNKKYRVYHNDMNAILMRSSEFKAARLDPIGDDMLPEGMDHEEYPELPPGVVPEPDASGNDEANTDDNGNGNDDEGEGRQ